MIAKLPKKDIIALVYITILTMAGLWYGFTSVPSPALQRDLSFDEARMSAINNIRYFVEDYYTRQAKLPDRLDDLKTSSAISSETLIDPQTKQQYEYIIVDETAYKVCAIFATDSSKQKKPNGQYYTTPEDHPKGYYCISDTATPEDSATVAPIWDPEDETDIPLGSDSAEPTSYDNNK